MKISILSVLVWMALTAPQQPSVERADALIVEAMKNLRNPPVAVQYADSALSISKTIGYEPGIAKASKIKGGMYAFMGKADSGYYFQQRALEIFIRLNDTLEIGKVTYNMAIYHNKRAEYEKTLELSLKALKNFELKNDKNGVGRALSLIGLTYYFQKKYAEAIAYFHMHRRNSIAVQDSVEIASSWTNLGAALDESGQRDSGMFYMLKAIDLKEKIGSLATLGTSYFNLASTYMEINQFDEAEAAFKKAFQHYTNFNDSLRLGEYYQTHAMLLQKQIKYAEAVRELNIAVQIARKTEIPETERNALGTLAEVYATLGNYEKAYQTMIEHAELSEELAREQNAEVLARMRTEFETERKELELAESKVILTETNLRIQQRNNQLILAGAILMITIISGALIYRNQKARQQRLQVEAELKSQLAEVEAKNALQQERLRISRELHDNIGSQLTFINSSIDSVGQSQKVEEVKRLTLDTIRELRKTVWLVNQTTVTLDEFAVKLREYLNQGSAVPVSVSVTGVEPDQKFSSAVATHVFRVIQEAVNNTLKHAKASAITVTLQAKHERVVLVIEDNGAGFSRDVVKSGYGLKNMEERIAAAGGLFSLTSKPGETRITLEVPVERHLP